MANKGCRVSKTQIFNSVYGLFSDDIDENVIESHISKLRKRLRQTLGYDPIDLQRFLGYRLNEMAPSGDVLPAAEFASPISSFAKGGAGFLAANGLALGAAE